MTRDTQRRPNPSLDRPCFVCGPGWTPSASPTPPVHLASPPESTPDARSTGRASELVANVDAVRAPSGGLEELVGEEGEAVTDRLGVDQAHGFLFARLAEQALAVPEHDGEDDEPQLVDQVVLE
jgi:hypothetical protein